MTDPGSFVFWPVAAVAAAVLYLLPGLALLEMSARTRRFDPLVKAGLAGAFSLSGWSLLFLAGSVIGFRIGRTLVVGLILLSGAALLAMRLRHPDGRNHRWGSEMKVGFLLAAGLFFVRMAVIRGMVAPAWGDSVHHTVIVQLLLDHGGLFQSWAPYAPLASFTYHFSFHSACAVWAMLVGTSAVPAVLAAGQALNVLAVLAVYPLAVFLTRSKWAALAAVAVAGFCSSLPGFYVNWGRYTQLAGQVILPAALYCAAVYWEEARVRTRDAWTLAVLWAGMFLAHYRVVICLGAGTIVVGLAALIGRFRSWRTWLRRTVALAVPLLAAIVLVLPWILNLKHGGLPDQLGRWVQRGGPVSVSWDAAIWMRLGFYYRPILLAAASAAAAWAVLRRRGLLLGVLGGWFFAAFLLANPHLFGLPGGRVESNAVLVFALYIPMAILIGQAVPEAAQQLGRFLPGRIVLFWSLFAVLVVGGRSQLRIVDPFYQMMTADDEAAFAYIRSHVPSQAKFLTNGYLAFGGGTVVGSDGGWWLTFYTRRPSWLPPIMYRTERAERGFDRDAPARMAREIPAALARPGGLAEFCRREGVTYLYLGERRGTVGFEGRELLPETDIRRGGGFSLLFEKGLAQVWRLDD